jgi:hypothetical protein
MIIVPAFAAPAYTSTTSGQITAQGAKYRFHATTEGNIPHAADAYMNSVLVFGYQWVDLPDCDLSNCGTGILAVVATKQPLDGSASNPNKWHVYNIRFTEHPTSTCLGSSQVVASESQTAVVVIHRNNIDVMMDANVSSVSPDTFDGVGAFILYMVDNGVLCMSGP